MKEDTLSSTPMAHRSSLYAITEHLGEGKTDLFTVKNVIVEK